jgi:Flp pilus assembly protein TadD
LIRDLFGRFLKGVAEMILSLSLLYSRCTHRAVLLSLCVVMLSMLVISAQGQSGGGTDLIGTGGRHSIQGRLYFPSGRRIDVRLKISLENYIAGNLSVLTDSNGTFSFRGLNAGSYTVVVDGGDDYETATQVVYIDTDGSISRRGVILPPVSRTYNVDISLRLKRVATTKPGVINAALANVPEQARELYEDALKLARSKEHKKAIEKLNKALEIYGDFPLALNELGLQYLELNQPGKAVEPLSAALRLAPDDFTSRLNYGYALLQSNRLADAESQLRHVLTKNDNSWPAHMYLGMTLLRLHRFEDAEVELRRSLAVSGMELAMPHYYLGGLYWAKNDFKRAADELEKYLKLAPGAPDAERTKNTIKDLRQRK